MSFRSNYEPTASLSVRSRRGWTHLVPVLLGAWLVLGASCGESNNTANETPSDSNDKSPPKTDGKRVETLAQVSTSNMTDKEKERWVELINAQLSPCGDPVSVGVCAQGSSCGRCVPAAKYIARLVLEGNDDSTIEDLYASRYGKNGAMTFDLEGAPVRGAAMAPVTIVEFSDFECPFCGRAAPVLHETVEEFKGKVRLVFMHYPLPMHDHALAAAKAAVAAQKQGKFWEMHDQLFEYQSTLSTQKIDELAQKIGLDMAKFKADFAAPETEAQVMADKAKGRKAGVDSTPSIYINGREYPYDESREGLYAYIREELE